MKEQKNIDKLFKTGISGVRIEPTAKVWQGIEKGFFGIKGFSSYKWYFIAAALLLLLASGSIWYFNASSEADRLPVTEETIVVGQEELDNKSADELKGIEDDIKINNPDNKIPKNDHTDIEVKAETSVDIPFEQTGDQTTNQSSANNASIDNLTVHDETELLAEDFYHGQPSRNIFKIEATSIPLTIDSGPNMIDPEKVTGLEEYLEKQRLSHLYTGATATGAMAYYPSTKDQFTWSVGLSFGLTAGRFFIETGLSYLDMKERGIYTIDLQSYDSVGFYNEVESFEIDPFNPDEIIYNTNKVTVYDSIDHYAHTTPYFKYKYINIPLSIGYKFFNKENFTAAIQTGLILSMMTDKNIPQADYYDPEYTIVRIHNKTPERVNWNLLWQVGIRLNYKFYRSMSVSAEPVFTKYLNSVYDTEIGYPNIKPYSMGLRVGIYYGF